MMGADQLAMLGARWPLDGFKVGGYGGFGVKRFNASEGACGTHDYPCTHWGVDLQAPAGSTVYAPFPGYVLYYGPADKPPFVGYGPWVCLIAHADSATPLLRRVWEWITGPLVDIADLPEGAVSTRYSLLGHLAPPIHTPGDLSTPDRGALDPVNDWSTDRIKPQSLVNDIWDASKSKPNVDHWRVMKKRPTTVVMYTDADGNNASRAVQAGQIVGTVSDANHVHWELRESPIAPAASGNWRLDPLDVFQHGYGLSLPPGVPPRSSKAPSSGARGGGGNALLLLAAMYAMSQRKRRTRR